MRSAIGSRVRLDRRWGFESLSFRYFDLYWPNIASVGQRSGRLPVKQEITGSNPVRGAKPGAWSNGKTLLSHSRNAGSTPAASTVRYCTSSKSEIIGPIRLLG